MATRLDMTGLRRIRTRLQRLGSPPDGAFVTLGAAWAQIIEDDNRKGVLAGLDKDGAPMVPVSYRPVRPGSRANARQKNNPAKGARRGQFAGFGPHAAGLNNNLTSAEYRRLDGPPLAPRKGFSRVITNLKIRMGRLGAWKFETVGYWDEVVSARGVKFLMAHFKGKGHLPRRDLRGLRPDGKRRAYRALRAWALDLLRSRSNGG